MDAHPSGPPEFAGPPAEPASLLLRWLAAAGSPVARPHGEAGVLLVPETAEFWVGQADRLHHRLHYGRTATGWETCPLQP